MLVPADAMQQAGVAALGQATELLLAFINNLLQMVQRNVADVIGIGVLEPIWKHLCGFLLVPRAAESVPLWEANGRRLQIAGGGAQECMH